MKHTCTIEPIERYRFIATFVSTYRRVSAAEQKSPTSMDPRANDLVELDATHLVGWIFFRYIEGSSVITFIIRQAGRYQLEKKKYPAAQ